MSKKCPETIELDRMLLLSNRTGNNCLFYMEFSKISDVSGSGLGGNAHVCSIVGYKTSVFY